MVARMRSWRTTSPPLCGDMSLAALPYVSANSAVRTRAPTRSKGGLRMGAAAGRAGEARPEPYEPSAIKAAKQRRLLRGRGCGRPTHPSARSPAAAGCHQQYIVCARSSSTKSRNPAYELTPIQCGKVGLAVGRSGRSALIAARSPRFTSTGRSREAQGRSRLRCAVSPATVKRSLGVESSQGSSASC